MALLDSNLVDALRNELNVGTAASSGNVSFTFYALSVADGADLDDEEKIQTAVDTITETLESELGVDVTVSIDWLSGIVSFNVIYEEPPE